MEKLNGTVLLPSLLDIQFLLEWITHSVAAWSGIKDNCVYVPNLLDNDIIIIGIEDGAGVAVEKLDYPADKMTHLLHDQSMRTPMWFHPLLLMIIY